MRIALAALAMLATTVGSIGADEPFQPSRRQVCQPTRYPRRTPQNSGNIAFTMSLMSERNAVGWNIWPSGM